MLTFFSQSKSARAANAQRAAEDFIDGLENAPEAFIGMLQGRNFGKLIVRVDGGIS